MKHGRKVYGFFRTEKQAEAHVANARKVERQYKDTTFNYHIVKRDRNKAGLKSWFAYRLVNKD